MSTALVSKFSRFCEVAGLSLGIKSLALVHTNDIGFDGDDFWAQFILANSGRLTASVTTLYKPDEKAALSRRFLQMLVANKLIPETAMGSSDLIYKRVFQGAGYYQKPEWTGEERRAEFLKLYPHWPTKIFGDVGVDVDETYKCIYPFQTDSFKDVGIEIVPGGSRLDAFIELLRTVEGQIVFVATGPLSNEAELLRREPILMREKVKAIFMMNGTFATPPRMGYNGALNYVETKFVFDSGIPCIIISSELCAPYKLPLETVRALEARKESLSMLGKTMLDTMLNWEIHRAHKKDSTTDVATLQIAAPILADPLAALIAINPELIGEIRPVRYTFNPSVLSEDYHMLHPASKEFVHVEEDPSSNVFEVVSLTDPEAVQKRLEEMVGQLFGYKDIVTSIHTVVAKAQRRIGPYICKTVQELSCDGRFFYSIHQSEQSPDPDYYQTIRSELLSRMKMDPSTPIIEVVGDSSVYSLRGTAIVKAFLARHITRETVMLYGYTGHATEEGSCCVNAAATEHVIENGMLDQTIGNLVGYHTPIALTKWGCSAPLLKHNILVYGDDETSEETGTRFGRDIVTSDYLADKLLVAEGGVQTFAQICNMLLLGRPVYSIGGLREESHYFSATEFIEYIRGKCEGTPDPTDDLLDLWKSEYLESKVLFRKKGDAGTKPALDKDAWTLFKEKELYKRLALIRLEGFYAKL